MAADEQDRQQIVAVIEQYRHGFATLNVEKLKAIWDQDYAIGTQTCKRDCQIKFLSLIISLKKLEYFVMKEAILSLLAGWIVGVLFGWLKLPLPAPPLIGFVGALGILFGAWSIEQFKGVLFR